MAFIMDGFLVLVLIVAIVGSVALYKATLRDAIKQKHRQEASRERAKKVDYDEGRFRVGAPLVCISCDPPFRFNGPLPSTGCPKCHTLMLVETQAEFDEETEKIKAKYG